MSNAPRRQRRASHMYHDSWRELCASTISARMDPKLKRYKKWRRLPKWVWSVITHSLSIQRQLYHYHTVWIGTCLYLLTIISCAIFAATAAFYLVYDVISKKTRSTVFTGTMNAVLGLCWISIAGYANYLGNRIFTSSCLHEKVRLHTKSLFRINTAILLLVVAFVGMALNFYLSRDMMLGKPCVIVGLNPIVCQIRYVSGIVYGVILIYWNTIVAWSILSICRTHTIGCRRFVQELEFEGRVMEKLYTLQLKESADNRMPDATLRPWEEEEMIPENVRPSDFMSELDDVESRVSELEHSHAAAALVDLPPPQQPPAAENPSRAPDTSISIEEDTSDHLPPSEDLPLRRSDARTFIFQKLESRGVREAAAYQKLLLSTEDVCIRVWKIGCSLRITGLVFQRWMSTWMSFTALWALSYIIAWLKQQADFFQLMNFLVPLALVGLVCAGYAEVNLECARIVKSLYPRADRLTVNRFLSADPPLLTVYNTPVTYQVIGGFVIAFVVAFTSRIVMDEFGKI